MFLWRQKNSILSLVMMKQVLSVSLKLLKYYVLKKRTNFTASFLQERISVNMYINVPATSSSDSVYRYRQVHVPFSFYIVY